MDEPHDSSSERATFLSLMLGALGMGLFFLVLLLITGGWFFFVGCAAGALVFLGLIHYALWGKSMSDQVAGQREEMQWLERAREQPAQKWTFRR
jgi:hypothetical protein